MADDPAGRLWSGIAWEIRRGRHPNRDDVVAALRLGDQQPLPVDVQLYIGRLLAGEIDQRGKPKHNYMRKQLVAHYLVRRVDRWHRVFRDRKRRPASQPAAFEKVASEYGWNNSATAERKYRSAKAELMALGLAVNNADWHVRQLLREHRWPPFDRGEKQSDLLSP